jgi:hypothetical protein
MGITEVTSASLGGVNRSGREVGDRSGGVKDRHEANQNLLDQTPYQADEKYIRDQ